MTIRAKLFACISALALAIVTLAGVSFWSMSTSKAALDTILQDRVLPMRDLKVVADKYAVDIVDASHKARNGNFTFAQSAKKVREGSALLHDRWKAYRVNQIDGEEAALTKDAEARMRIADERVAELQSILDRGDRAALDAFVLGKLYASIEPVSDTIGQLVDLQLKIAAQTGSDATTTAQTSRNAILA
ncbi:Tar ligand binding domain-containing protein [Sphingomonas sp. Leaf10]|uniref:Tar ligand binding domain-containing protein n=1 Tax=Sphingomonas sp. Leaf10 TaxID=1735676 RepID=UPI0009E91930|nr:Tar ligand binding domain-containing protein [Sphingomonas sp. Leaf10]